LYAAIGYFSGRTTYLVSAMKLLWDYFSLKNDQEKHLDVVKDIEKDVIVRGANLWILIFAIFVASLGLNVNSTAVIIGAMLISPLMGPIMGLGLGMGINDLDLMRKSLFSYLFSAGISLATSTIYFLITPINSAHSEILARTSPNIYDVLIAFFGGLAGIIAVSCMHKGNVIPGVAIATALMPPLCTAGYGLATFQMTYFFGAFYLFLINTVFIALATLVVVRLLKFPYKKLVNHEAEIKAKRIAWVVVVVTLLPSLYFGFDIVQKERFRENAQIFIEKECLFSNDYLLDKTIDAGKKSIVLTYGGRKITAAEIEQLKTKLVYYKLGGATLTVRQGFEYLNEVKKPLDQMNPLQVILSEKENELNVIKTTIDSIKTVEAVTKQLFIEAKALNPNLKNLAFTALRVLEQPDTIANKPFLVYLQFSKLPNEQEKKQFESWLVVKLNKPVKVVFDL